MPRYVSLKSDHVNVRAGPTKDNDVAWVYTRSACRSKSPPSSRTGAACAIPEGSEGWVYHSLLSGRALRSSP